MYRFSVLIFFLLIIVGCTPDEEVFPSIEVEQPSDHEHYSFGDTMHVKARVYSDEPINWVEVTLLNQQFIPVCPSQSIYPEEADSYISMDYIIDNPEIENGLHYLLIEAQDKSGSTKKFVSLDLNGLALRSIALITIIRNGTNQQAFLKIDSLLAVNQVGIHNGDYSSSAINSKQSLLYINGRYTGSLSAFDLNSGETVWNIPAILNPPFSFFEQMIFQDNIVVEGYTDGKIMGMTGSGSPRYQFVIQQFIPKSLLRHYGMLIVEQLYYTGAGTVISAYYENSGSQKCWIGIDYDIITMFSENEEKVIIFGNDETGGISARLDLFNDISYELTTFGSNTIYSCIQIDNYNYLISTMNGIMRYNPMNGQSVFFESGVHPGTMCYDKVDNVLYIAYDKTIDFYNQSTTQFLGSINLADTIRDIHIQYNK